MSKNFLRPYFTNVRNSLECLSLASLSSLVEYLWVMLRASPKGDLLLGAPILGRLLALLSNIIQGRKGLPGANDPA
jgi:hypothetical protein